MNSNEQGLVDVLIQFKRLGNHDLPLPAYQSAEAAGMDLRALEAKTIQPGEVWLCPIGFACAIQKGYEGQVRPRSGLATKSRITVVNSPGTIDSDYRGPLLVGLINLSDGVFQVEYGMRIAQMVISPVVRATIIEADQLDETIRGSGGFGSSGLK
jgi:dUTP pyrophosphatase